LRMASNPNSHKEATGFGLTMALFSLAWYHQYTRSTSRFLIDTQPSSHLGYSTLQILPLSHCRELSITQKYRSLLSQAISTSRPKISRRCWRTCTTTRKRVRAFLALVRPFRRVNLTHHIHSRSPLRHESSFHQLSCILRVSSPQQLGLTSLFELANRDLVALFPGGPAPFTHRHPTEYLEEALELAMQYDIHLEVLPIGGGGGGGEMGFH
jgi:hypothetical protein